jgi:hypothetical protein
MPTMQTLKSSANQNNLFASKVLLPLKRTALLAKPMNGINVIESSLWNVWAGLRAAS